MANELIPANSAVVFPVTLLLNGQAWDLTGSTVSLLLRDGLGEVSEHPATVTDAVDGEAECTLSASDMALVKDGREWYDAAASAWERQWRVQAGGDDVRSLWIPFTVVA